MVATIALQYLRKTFATTKSIRATLSCFLRYRKATWQWDKSRTGRLCLTKMWCRNVTITRSLIFSIWEINSKTILRLQGHPHLMEPYCQIRTASSFLRYLYHQLKNLTNPQSIRKHILLWTSWNLKRAWAQILTQTLRLCLEVSQNQKYWSKKVEKGTISLICLNLTAQWSLELAQIKSQQTLCSA
jgi:hypothetical protein